MKSPTDHLDENIENIESKEENNLSKHDLKQGCCEKGAYVGRGGVYQQYATCGQRGFNGGQKVEVMSGGNTYADTMCDQPGAKCNGAQVFASCAQILRRRFKR